MTHCTKPTTKDKINQTGPPATPKSITGNPTKPESVKPRATTADQTNLKKKKKTQNPANPLQQQKIQQTHTDQHKSQEIQQIQPQIHKNQAQIVRRDREENDEREREITVGKNKTIGEQKAAGGRVGDATSPLEKISQASKSEREECEEEEELLW
jgi:hypothetical protein